MGEGGACFSSGFELSGKRISSTERCRGGAWFEPLCSGVTGGGARRRAQGNHGAKREVRSSMWRGPPGAGGVHSRVIVKRDGVASYERVAPRDGGCTVATWPSAPTAGAACGSVKLVPKEERGLQSVEATASPTTPQRRRIKSPHCRLPRRSSNSFSDRFPCCQTAKPKQVQRHRSFGWERQVGGNTTLPINTAQTAYSAPQRVWTTPTKQRLHGGQQGSIAGI